MQSYTMMVSLRRSKVHLRLLEGQRLMLRATLPTPAQFWTGKPVKALLESLAIWLDTQVRVVLDAEDIADGFTLELTDELGTGLRTLFYNVEVVIERRPRRAQAPSLRADDGATSNAGGQP
jgi:hypothetical protein